MILLFPCIVTKVEVALASDAARLITDAVESAPEEYKIEAQSLECGGEITWEIGEEFTNHLLTVSKKNCRSTNYQALPTNSS